LIELGNTFNFSWEGNNTLIGVYIVLL